MREERDEAEAVIDHDRAARVVEVAGEHHASAVR
jgi:hypothetical protein